MPAGYSISRCVFAGSKFLQIRTVTVIEDAPSQDNLHRAGWAHFALLLSSSRFGWRIAVIIVVSMSDAASEGSRGRREDAGVQRLEKILSKHVGEPRQSQTEPRRSTSNDSAAEQPRADGASVGGLLVDTGPEAVPLRHVLSRP